MKYINKGGNRMKLKKTVAKAITKASMAMAKKACGAASCYCTYQPKEPKALQKMTK